MLEDLLEDEEEYALRHRKTVLVIENDHSYLTMLVSLLEAYGYSVETATSGSEGARKYQEMKPDLVIINSYLPIIGGLAAANLLRSSYYSGKVE